MTELTDKTLGEFHLLRHLGSGGMADVYLAEQTTLQRYVAVKVMKPRLMELSGDEMVARFKQEAMAAAGLNHPNIVQVYTIGQEGEYHYIAQEYVEGRDLASILKSKGKPDLSSALHIMRQVLSALKAAGEAGIVHRDIKPENILITKRGEVKIADFGLAQLLGRNDGVQEREGTTMGTPLFMSPEQVSGKELDPRSDLYSFGVTCYQMLCGETPFRGATPKAIATQHLKTPPPPLGEKNPGLPNVICRLVHRMMAKRRALRYQSADEVSRDLKKLITAYKQGRVLDLVRLPRLEELDRAAEQARAASPTPASKPRSASPEDDFELGEDAILNDTTEISHPEVDLEHIVKKKHADLVRKPLPSWSDEDDEYHPRKPQTDFDEMDLTPMVDVTFLLLIFFMITASFSMQKSFDFPPAQNDEGATTNVTIEPPDSGVLVTVDADNIIYVENSRATDYDEVFQLLESEKANNSSLTDVELQMDPDSTHVMRVIVIDAATQAGFLRIRNRIREL